MEASQALGSDIKPVNESDYTPNLTLIHGVPENPQSLPTAHLTIEDVIELKRSGYDVPFNQEHRAELKLRAASRINELLGVEFRDVPVNRLYGLDKKSDEKSEAFLGRIEDQLNGLDLPLLTSNEVSTVLKHIPGWRHMLTGIDGEDHSIIYRNYKNEKRNLWPNVETETFTTSRRIVAWKDSALTLLTEFVTPEDLQVVLDIHRLEEEQKKTAGVISNEAIQIASVLLPSEKTVVAKLYKTNQQIALEGQKTEQTVSTQIRDARIKTGLSTSQLCILALRSGLMKLEDVPGGKKNSLELPKRQKEVLTGYHDKSYEEAVKDLGMAMSTIRTHWHRIFQHTGAPGKRQAFMAAIKDRLIPITPLEAELQLAQ